MKPFKSIQSPRTLIRRFRVDDKPDLISLLCDKEVTKHMAFPDEMLTPEGVSELLDITITSYTSPEPLLSFAIEDIKSKAFLGVSGFTVLTDNEIEIFYAFLPKYWGRGLATEILEYLSNYVFEQDPRHTVVAPITWNNPASIKVAEKNGFKSHGLKEDPNYKEPVYIYKKKR
ncbi:GNAT family N-acetyltransferase [Poritiphilus flavus]|uniref:GNAT family N-acetyltransferase n=1 Tax=Poritiphilus flavus TaxID=2697053 RepID=A0A6L9EH56_9FLAO|nr:GNAT family N-acetyltransferase [Poritiphilus flavus]NAS14094.1 GNAT family N-acetyltransferase [Poritiphilus flavus]